MSVLVRLIALSLALATIAAAATEVLSANGQEEPPLAYLGLRWEIWSNLEKDDAVLELVQPIRPAAFLRLLAGTAPGGGAPAAVHAEMPLVVFWKPRKIWPLTLADSCSRGSGPGRANFYHFFAEWMPALSYTLCEQFDVPTVAPERRACSLNWLSLPLLPGLRHRSYSNRGQLQIVDVQRRYGCHQRERYRLYYHEAVSCLSDKPLHHINGTALRDQLTLVRTAWLGLGPRCRGVPPGCYKAGSGRLPPTAQLTSNWRNLLGQCMGLDASAQAPLQPLQLLVVDRLYASGRHMLNVESVVRALRARFTPQHVDVRLAYLEGMSLKEQAALFAASSVVLHVHGAAISNYFSLLRHAVAVQLAPMLRHYRPSWYTDYLQEELAGISDIEVITWYSDDPWLAHLNTEKEAAELPFRPNHRRFVQNRTEYGHFLRHYSCPKWMRQEARGVCNALLYQLNVVVPVEAAVNLTDRAVLRAFETQGRRPPERLFTAAGAAGAGRGGAGGGGSSGGGGLGGVLAAFQALLAEQQQGHAAAEGAEAAGGAGGLGVHSLPPLSAAGGMQALLLGATAGAWWQGGMR
ncbi:hypothetical protein ABPG75_012057 [Micractinium tetrahymenae]